MVDVVVRGAAHDARIDLRPGGSAANAAVWAAHCGAHATVVGRVGDDPAGRMLRRELEARRVQCRLTVDGEAPTGTFVFSPECDVPVSADRGASARLAPADVEDSVEAGALLVSGYLLLGGDAAGGASAALAGARSQWIAVDAASARLLERFGADRFLGLTAHATVLLANEEEARVLTGRGPEAAARALAQGRCVACVKRGAAGAVAARAGRLEVAAAPAVHPPETVGAGDAFAAGLLVSLANGRELGSALAAACACGARAAESAGRWPR